MITYIHGSYAQKKTGSLVQRLPVLKVNYQ